MEHSFPNNIEEIKTFPLVNLKTFIISSGVVLMAMDNYVCQYFIFL